MNIQTRFALAVAAAVVAGGANAARAQTVVNLTNLDPSNTGYSANFIGAMNAGTNLDLLNTTTALSNGGLFGGAVSNQTQQATNQLNTIGLTSTGAAAPVVLGNQTPVTGTPTVTINTIASAYNAEITNTTDASGAIRLSNTGGSTLTLRPGDQFTVGGNTYTYAGTYGNGTPTAGNLVLAPGTDQYYVSITGAAPNSPIPGAGATSIAGLSVANPNGTAYWNAGTSITGTLTAGTSATINNTNAAVSGGVNQIVGAPNSLNALYTGGYGPTSGNVQVGGNQVGINTINGVGAAFAGGTAVTLSQLPGAPSPNSPSSVGTTPIIQGGALNMSTVNTLLAYTGAGAASVNGSGSTAGAPGAQTAVNTFNTATLVGDISVAAQQNADGLNNVQTALQSVNRAMAFSAGATSANIDPSVTNLNQSAAVGINALNLLAGSTGATTLSGTQSTGYNTSNLAPLTGSPTAGATPVAAVTNQAVATTVDANGFLPSAMSIGGQAAAWSALTNQIGASGAPLPTAQSSVGSGISSRLTGNPDAANLNGGNVNVGNLGQAINLTNNTVAAGTASAPVSVTFGPAGFAQTAGSIGISTNTSGDEYGGNGLNNAVASTGVGASAINAITQAFQSANNTFQGTGNISGALSQSASALNFAAGRMAAPGATGTVLAINGGSGQYNGSNSNSGPFSVVLSSTEAASLNNATASSIYGTAALTGAAQSGNTFANVASTSGTIDPGAASTLSQSLGALQGYSSVGQPGGMNTASSWTGQGNTSVSSVTQGLSLTANAVSGTAGVNGSVAQASGDTNGMQPQNGLSSASYGQGSASLASNVQTNATSINSIASNGALGSATSPAAFSQAATATTTHNGAYDAGWGNTGNATFYSPSNFASVNTYLGAGASATSNGLTQVANLSTNAITGGTASGTGITGNATQTSTDRSSTIANQAMAGAMGAPYYAMPGAPGTLGAQGVMSGNATMLNTAQSSAQSLNTMSLAGANNGILNQATFGTTNQTTGNAMLASSNAGYAVATGAQLATNAANVISAR